MQLKDVFISYGRKESLAFSTKLFNQLENAGFSTWFDHFNIPKGDDFQQRIDNGIESAKNFVFIIAPHAIQSAFCLKEIELALKYKKRIIPILHIERCLEEIHPEIGKINWIYAREKEDINAPIEIWKTIDDFDKAFKELTSLLQFQNHFIEQHTLILLQALTWNKNQKKTVNLLIGNALKEAEHWLLTNFTPPEQPPCKPSDLHAEYICESKKNAENLYTETFISFDSQNETLKIKIGNALSQFGITNWTHNQDVKSGDNFQDAIKTGIIQANNFLFLITKESIISDLCLLELKIALGFNKRIIPLLLEDANINELPEEIRSLQCIDFTDNQNQNDFTEDIENLLQAIHKDRRYHQQHKTFLAQATKWQSQDKNPSILLRGFNLQNAEVWLTEGFRRERYYPTNLQKEFIEESLSIGKENYIEVFISYSRADSDFARNINEQLQLNGKTTWFDQESIAEGSDFKKEIFKGIEKADNFLFIISPDAVISHYCQEEIDYAIDQGKRILTIYYRSVETQLIPNTLSDIQWIDFQKDFSNAFSNLIRTLNIDQEYVHFHSQLQLKALEWERKNKSKDLLQRGVELGVSQKWIHETKGKNKKPEITELQISFIENSESLAAFEKKKEQDYLLKLEKALKKAEEEEKKAKKALEISVQKTKEAQSMVLSSLARDYVKDDNTKALRIAQAAYNHSEPNHIPVVAKQSLVKVANSIADNQPLYQKDLKHDGPIDQMIYSNEGKVIATSCSKTTFIWDTSGNLINTITSEKSEVRDLQFSSSGKEILISTKDYNARLFNLKNGELIDFKNLNESIQHCSFSPKNKFLLTLCFSNIVKIWDYKGKLFCTLDHHTDKINHAVFSRNGLYIATSSEDKSAKIFNLKGELIFNFENHSNPILRSYFSPNDQYLIVNPLGNEAYLYNLKEKNATRSVISHNGNIWEIKFSSEESKFISRSQDQTVKIWDLYGNLSAEINDHESKINSANFSYDGQYIVTSSKDKTVKVWNLKGELISTYLGHQAEVTEAIFSQNDRNIYSYGLDNIIKIWAFEPTNANGVLKTEILNHTKSITSILSLENDKLFTASKDGSLKIWDLRDQLIAHWQKSVFARGPIIFSPNGKMILSGGTHKNALLNDINGTLIHDFKNFEWHIYLAKFSNDSEFVLLGSRGKDAYIYDINGILKSRIFNQDSEIDNAFFSSNNQYIISLDKTQNSILWDINGQLITNFSNHFNNVKETVFSKDSSKIILIDENFYPNVWDIGGNKVLLNFDEIVGNLTYSMFLPETESVLVADQESKYSIYNIEGKELVSNKSLPSDVKNITYSQDSQKLLFSTFSDDIYLWNLNQDTTVQWEINNSRLLHIQFTPNNKNIISINYQENKALIWGLNGELIKELEFDKVLDNSIYKINNLIISPDSKYLLTTFQNKPLAKLWDLEGNLIGDYLHQEANIQKSLFSPEGKQFITVSKDNSAILWATPEKINSWLAQDPIPKINLEEFISF